MEHMIRKKEEPSAAFLLSEIILKVKKMLDWSSPLFFLGITKRSNQSIMLQFEKNNTYGSTGATHWIPPLG